MWALVGSLLTAGSTSSPARRKPGRLTADGALLFHGKPFFPIGIYHVDHTDAEYAMVAANGFNAIEGSFTTNVQGFRKTLDMAEKYGLAVDAPLFANSQVKENLEASLAKIREAGAHPALLSWKIIDEPDANRNGKLRSEVVQEYRIIKQLYPEQLLELTLSEDDTLSYWSKFCDVVQIDRYPLPGGPLTQVSAFCDAAAKARERWQNLTFVVQCGWTPDLRTQPSFAQARCMVYLALVSGAKGIFWYSRQEDDWDLTKSPLWPRLKEINVEIASLSNPLLLGTDIEGVRCGDAGIHFAAKQYLGKAYLLATNPSPALRDAVFTIPNAGAAGSPHLRLDAFGSATIVIDLAKP